MAFDIVRSRQKPPDFIYQKSV
ncbi:hypothetical protein CGLO_13289 [Colletotrichum gloeosporioides Cg-14]|uniref:Uncharacterized protein n=1 Tax=Colletotrichum gloeosporioides (strain Cg-14) TaxID=1237896 RepID=T0K427_COLGC|nr:hypothetical protein CGLO_13289 [Colletotrichum gloeosporioides Cg-14]